eukprot:SAG22_NODE_113_length_19407_cov_214.925161_12_plen_71_part_00
MSLQKIPRRALVGLGHCCACSAGYFEPSPLAVRSSLSATMLQEPHGCQHKQRNAAAMDGTFKTLCVAGCV